MSLILFIAKIVLVIIFGVAGLAKLAKRTETQETLVSFGVPNSLVPASSLLLPLVEVGLAVALLSNSTAWWAALGMAILLFIFVVAISFNMAWGRRPDCRCFGQLHSAPIGWSTLSRNLALMFLAGLIVWQEQAQVSPGERDWLSELAGLQLILLTAGLLIIGIQVAEGWFLYHLLRQNGRLILRIETLEHQLTDGAVVTPATEASIGAVAPSFQLANLAGEIISLEDLRATGKPLLLLFTDPDCPACLSLLPEVAGWQQDYQEKLTIALISRGTVEANQAKSKAHGLVNVLIQHDYEVAQAYQVTLTPSAILIQPDGIIGSQLASGVETIRLLAHQTISQLPNSPGNNGQIVPHLPARIGAPIPPLRLPGLNEAIINLEELRGAPTLILLWEPDCHFCQQIVAELKNWDPKRLQQGIKLLIISSKSFEESLIPEWSSTVAIDPRHLAGRVLGATGTPAAVLVDADGLIASPVATGAKAVLKLLAEDHVAYNERL